MKFSNKTLGWLVFIGIVLVIYVANEVTGKKTETPEQQLKLSRNNAEALVEIIDQPNVLDATITEANVLYAQVNDEGTNRNGYACSLCERLRKYNSTVLRVKLVKVNSSNDPNRDNAYGILLGECVCQK